MNTTQEQPRGYAAAFDQWDDVQPELFAPVIDYPALAAGAVVKHLATKRIEKNGRKYALHTLATRGGNGETFAIWGSAGLNDRLRSLKAGGVVYLRYDGKHPHATDASKTEHRFTVKTPATPAKLADGMRALEAIHRAMEQFIQEEATRQREERIARARGGDVEPPADTEFAPLDESDTASR